MRKRLAFCKEVIAACQPGLVIDIGCGTGVNLTRPLAERFSRVRFIGIDSDAASIECARRGRTLPNLSFGSDDELERHRQVDLIIASEVIEHVEEPDAFLADLQARLASQGRMIVTLPNGRGPFELVSSVEVLLRLVGLVAVLQGMKHCVAGSTAIKDTPDTLAVSPHINFMSYHQIRNAFTRSGLAVERYRARTFLCGFGFDQVLRSPGAVAWNARIADCLPPGWVSAWMFLLTKCSPQDASRYRRGFVARWHRGVNERYWRVGSTEDRCR